MITMKKQRGLSFVGLMMILAVGAFIGLFGLKIFPFYTENSSVNTALDSLIGVPNLGKQGKRAIVKRVDAQFYINDVHSLTAKDLVIKKGKSVWYVTADYETRTEFFGDIGLFAHFTKTVEIPRK